ncbi:Metalloprotease PmbA [Buchnera aphidicola (Cinara kochiana kochiana)]|uniref:Metalloprotease PmbA n=1 Tax=Buchnera aphidicola (Cinara kochiana kochiana) TaxID=2518976 RepID=A0A451D561_9GAMM|nr:metallopeptidase TldD-related protein [Buchnera aphidicola]VFP80979.1 Metalloprotease PmbA [Buchnera aphidicola (Cinara kochiana kochiana)]
MLFFNDVEKDLNVLLHNMQQIIFYLNKNKYNSIVKIKKTYCLIVSNRYGSTDNIELFNYINSAVTTYNNHKQYSVESSDASIAGICKSIDKSIYLSQYVTKDQFIGLPHANLLYCNDKKINLFFPQSFSINEINDLVNIADSAALNFDSRIVNTDSSAFEYFVDIKVIGNSLGWIGHQLSTYNCLSSCVVARDHNSMEKDFSYTVSRDFNDLDDPIFVGQNSARKSIAKLNSKKISTQVSPIIFSSDISYELFFCLMSAINGHVVYNKSTFLLNYLGKKIFPNWLNIFENPFLNKGLSSSLFDNEGVATVTRKIIKNGILKTWLLDTYSSNRLNMYNTGHAGAAYNWLVSASANTKFLKSFDDIIHSMYQGFFVTELLGDGFNIMTGEYSSGACGFWIEKGKIQYPVHEITISGNLLDIWKNIVCMADDINLKNKIQCSSLLIDKIQISGF